MNRVFLFVSDVSTLLGVSRYNPQNCFERLFKKYDYKTIELIKTETVKTIQDITKQKELVNKKADELKQKLSEKKLTQRQYDMESQKIKKEEFELTKTITDNQECIDLLTLSKKEYIEKKIGKENIETINSAKNITEKNEKTKELKKHLEDNTELSKETIQLISKEMKNMINTEYGIEKESNAIETFEKIENVKLNTSQDFFKCNLCTVDGKEFFLGGKLDGIHKDYIVEIKNRTRQFFYKIRDYEMIQIQLYMYILNYRKAKLVEKLNHKIKIHDVERDDVLIQEIMTKINIFCNLFTEFLKNDEKKREYYTSSFTEKENFIYSNFYLKIETEYLKLKSNNIVIDSEDELDSMECCISISE
jgi:hypothetical protein